MIRPIPIQEKHQRFSLSQLPINKLIGFLLCFIMGNPRRFIPIVIVLVLGIVGIVYALCLENSEQMELQNLNAQASQLVFKNQSEEAIKIYDQILERVSKRSDSMSKEWAQRIRGARTMAASKSEMALLRKSQPLIAQANTLMKDGKISEAKEILKQVSDELEKNPWKGKPTETMMAKIRAIKK
jgi:tetratricopeptide (TPR) repeat protein